MYQFLFNADDTLEKAGDLPEIVDLRIAVEKGLPESFEEDEEDELTIQAQKELEKEIDREFRGRGRHIDSNIDD